MVDRSSMRERIQRCIDWCRRGRLDRELAEEIQFHRRQLEQAGLDADLPPQEAARAARMRFGNVTHITQDTRERWSIRWMDHLQQDVRYALRGLRRTPAFTATVVLTLSLGIGANAAMLGVVDQLMFRPLGWLTNPGTVHGVYQHWTDGGRPINSPFVSYQRYHDLREWTTSFSDAAAYNERLMVIGVGESAREMRVSAVTASYFDFFSARPVMGRFFAPSDDQPPHGEPVVVLSHGYWQREFGGRDVLGQTLQIGASVMTIIGVAPSGFNGVDDAQPPVLFMPLTSLGPATGGNATETFSTGYRWLWAQMIVRRKADVPVDAASADLTTALRRSWEAQRLDNATRVDPVDTAQPRVTVASLRPGGGPNPNLSSRTALWVSGVSAIVLLIVCANVANLLLGRAVQRRAEIALRLALGVTQSRLLAQCFVESLMLALLGAAGGLTVANWAGPAAFAILVPAGTGVEPFAGVLDWRIAMVSGGIALLVGLLTGMAPGLLARRVGLSLAIKTGGRGGTSSGRGLRATLVVAQAAFSVVLLLGAAFFIRSFTEAKGTRMGYDIERVLVISPVLRGVTLTPPQHANMARQLLATAQALPEVEAASWRTSFPFGMTMRGNVSLPGRDDIRQLGEFTLQQTTGDYFQVMGTRILQGRPLTAEDRAGAPLVAVVSQSMANLLWPQGDALSQCMRVGPPTAPCTTIVGVAEDVVLTSLTVDRPFHFYVPIEQAGGPVFGGMLLRTRGTPADAARAVTAALQPLMPGLSYVSARPLEEFVSRAHRSWELGATMFGALAALALAVAAVGLYGVVNFATNQRLREFGVRAALGARRSDVFWLAMTPGARFAGAGVTIGLLLGLGASHWLQPLLFETSATDPAVYALVGVLVLLVAVASSAVPALRAARAEPHRALRAE